MRKGIVKTAMPALGLSLFGIVAAGESPKKDYPVKPVDFTKVTLKDEFWAPRLEMNRSVTIPFAFQKNEETGRVDNLRKAAGLTKGPYLGKRYNDSDVFKVMEAAAYSLLLRPDPELRKRLDDLVRIVGLAQESDGYLYSARTVDPKKPADGAGQERWSNLRVSHELYNVGHMYEAAVAHFLATGEKTFLDIALKNAGLLLETFGPGKKRGFPGHQEIEIGLAKLYRMTGEQRYLDLAKFFLDERGRYHGGEMYPPDSPFVVYNGEEYMQNHKPVLEQAEAVGHAVRASYMYSGMADVAALGGYPEYSAAIDRLWENVVGKKLYLTGGIGARAETEGFGAEYELPNAQAFAETCAAIGNTLWNHRLFLLHGDGKYIDVLERVLYNGLLSGVSLSGDLFFYHNPLESAGDYGRSPWFEVACCPANVARFLPSIPGYVYAVQGDIVFANLYIANEAKFSVNGKDVYFIVESKYPWEGGVTMGINPVGVNTFTLSLRIPGWARNEPTPGGLYRFLDRNEQAVRLKVNGKTAELEIDRGYARVRRKWRKGDVVELRFPMPIRRIVADEHVKDDEGRVALQRGPIVYCAEGVDNAGHALNIVLPEGARLQSWYRPDLLGGVEVITGQVMSVQKAPTGKPETRMHNLFAVPYCVWAHRGKSEMAVWFSRGAAKSP